MKMNRNNN